MALPHYHNIDKAIVELGYLPRAYQFADTVRVFFNRKRANGKSKILICGNSSDGRVLRASSSGVVDSSLIPSRVKPITLLPFLLADWLVDCSRHCCRCGRSVVDFRAGPT